MERFMTHAPIVGQLSLPPTRHRLDSSSLQVGTPRASLSGVALTRVSSHYRMASCITLAPVFGKQSPKLMLLHRGMAPHLCGRAKSSSFGEAPMRPEIRSAPEQSIILPLTPGHLSRQPVLLRRVRATPRSGTALASSSGAARV